MNGRPLRHLSAADRRSPREALFELAAAMPAEATADVYGDGELVAALERDVAAILGKPAAVFALSGKAAQLAALRVHAERRARTVVAAHPRSHLVEDEDDAIGRLHGLRVARIGRLTEPFDAAQLAAITDPLAAVVVELPLRRVGFRVPAWSELEAVARVARDAGAAVHLDGARLWETAPGYGRTPAEIAALFDTVYVSFYKGLGGLAGAALAGDAATIAAARTWIGRAGAIVYHAYPFVVAAHAGLRDELPRMPAYYERAVALAAALRGLDGVVVSPDPPASTSFAIHVRAPVDALQRAGDALADARGIGLFRWLIPTSNPAWCTFEVAVGAATMTLEPAEVRDAVAELIALAGVAL